MTNGIDKGFLASYRLGRANETRFLPLARGFLKLRYGLNDEPEVLSIASYVLEPSDDAIAVGPRLEFRLPKQPGGERATFMTENGVSGRQWSCGNAYWGNTYDDTSSNHRRWITLDDWVDECLEEMVNPNLA